jgi:hypothetical protein
VLGTGLSEIGAGAVGAALLVGAVAAWAPLLRRVLRHRRAPAPGSAFLVAVSTQAVAVLCCAAAADLRAAWLAATAVPLVVGGLGLYAVAAASFDPDELVRGRGDHWVAGGALAIPATAAASVADDALRLATG